MLSLALVGATGAVGRSLLTLLDRGLGPRVDHVVAVASRASLGTDLRRRLGLAVPVSPVVTLDQVDFAAVDATVFCAGADVSRRSVGPAAEAGTFAVDNSSAFRMRLDVPLVVPQVNPQALDRRPPGGLVANPNCSSIQLVRALYPLHQLAGLEEVVVCTYQAASGGGLTGLAELANTSAAVLRGPQDALGCPMPMPTMPGNGRFGAPLAFNLVPQIGPVDGAGSAHEERKLVREPRKIFDLPRLRVSATAVRVPVFHCHSEAVHVRLARPVQLHEVEAVLAGSPGLRLYRAADRRGYPMPADVVGADRALVHVGRVRVDPEDPRSVSLWIVADNLWVGAALNALQILELAVDRGLTG